MTACRHDGYGGIHAGVTKSGVKKEKNGLTRLTAADCSDDGKWRDDIDTVNKLSSRFGWAIMFREICLRR